MGLSTAERNRRKRERKKKERAEELKRQQEKEESASAAAKAASADADAEREASEATTNDDTAVEVEYVVEIPAVPEAGENHQEALKVLKRFQERAAAAVVSDADEAETKVQNALRRSLDPDNDEDSLLSKRKLRDMLRPSVADLKRRVDRPDLVEAHDVTATDPDFLIRLKSVPGTVPVPRHWGRKRKYLQGKRGFEKRPFQLPDFLVNTGITELRDSVMESENDMSAKQKNRARVTPKLGAVDVDYRTLHDAFFKHQTKPTNLTKFGDLYYEGKELEATSKMVAGQPLSPALRAALGMTTATAPPPWLLNMQRYGPPPSYPGLPIPGLNAPLPSPDCQYGYHPGGWGKPPVDAYGRPLYGGNPFDPPGSGKSGGMAASSAANPDGTTTLVTSDGKTVSTSAAWGALPEGLLEAQAPEDEEESSSDEEMEESESEEEVEEEEEEGMASTLPPPSIPHATAPVDLRKTGTETPMSVAPPPKQLYQVLEQKAAPSSASAVFASEIAYAVPTAAPVPEGAESVLSKQMTTASSSVNKEGGKRRKKSGKDEDEEEEELGKTFKF